MQKIQHYNVTRVTRCSIYYVTTNPALQREATAYVQHIIDNNPDDIFVWCDGSVRYSVPQCSAACAIVIYLQLQIKYHA